MRGEKVGVVFTWAGKNNAHNGENGAKSLDLLRGLRERGTCAYKNESSYFIPDYGSKDMEPWLQNRGKNRSKKGMHKMPPTIREIKLAHAVYPRIFQGETSFLLTLGRKAIYRAVSAIKTQNSRKNNEPKYITEEENSQIAKFRRS